MEGYIENVRILFTADTGATRTIISKRIFDRIPRKDKPRLVKAPDLVGPGGKPLLMYGKTNCKLTLGDLTLDVEVIVAEIDDEGLLGIDVLQKHYTGPADILLSKGEIHLSGHKILCIQIGGQIKVRKVRAADHYMIQGKCEQIIDVLVERQMPDYYSDKCEVIIEPSTEFTETYPLLMAPTVVDLNRGATQKVRVLNPFDTEVSIKQDSVVGLAESFSNMKT